MSEALVVASGETTVESLIALITRHHVGCIPIVDTDHRPIGIVTKLDLVECREPGRKTARDVMMPHARAFHPEDTLARAVALMTSEGFHHVLVVDAGRRLKGVVSTFDVTRWLASVSNPT